MLDPAHINIMRNVVIALGSIFVTWFVVMFIYFWLGTRR